MEATGRDGSWSYREQSGIISSSYTTISSTSGTFSTGYTSYTSNGSHLSWISTEAARHFQEIVEEDAREFVRPTRKETELAKLKEMSMSIETAQEKMKQVKSLAKEFFGASSAKAKCSALDKWFEKLGVGWVLHVVADGVAGAAAMLKLEQALDVSSWIRALAEIGDAFTASLSSGHGSAKEEEQGPAADQESEHEHEHEQQDVMTEQFQFATFTKQAMLKMLDFVDLMIDAPNLNITCDTHLVAVPRPYQKLYTMLRVRNALLINLSSYPPPSAQVASIKESVVWVLSSKQRKAGEAIWNTMEEIRNGILQSVGDGDDSSPGTQTPQGSSDIHKATRSVVGYIIFLQRNYSSVAPVVSEAVSLGKYIPHIGVPTFFGVPTLTSLVVEMMSCTQEKLVNNSEKFPDQSLRFLFLLNNSSSIGNLIHYSYYFPESYKASFSGKVDGYMESYMQVSWAPVLACLFNPKPLRLFGKNNSTLLKFESKFHKTYTTQKLWKVPDPKLRKTLREAIIVKMVPRYTKYIEDNNVTTPKLTPQILEEMLQELFEG